MFVPSSRLALAPERGTCGNLNTKVFKKWHFHDWVVHWVEHWVVHKLSTLDWCCGSEIEPRRQIIDRSWGFLATFLEICRLNPSLIKIKITYSHHSWAVQFGRIVRWSHYKINFLEVFLGICKNLFFLIIFCLVCQFFHHCSWARQFRPVVMSTSRSFHTNGRSS